MSAIANSTDQNTGAGTPREDAALSDADRAWLVLAAALGRAAARAERAKATSKGADATSAPPRRLLRGRRP